MTSRRLFHSEIDLVLSLAIRGGIMSPISLQHDHRAIVGPLWRRQLVELWFRRPPAEHSSQMHEPFYRLTESGAQIALAIREKRKSFISAPREHSGAGEV